MFVFLSLKTATYETHCIKIGVKGVDDFILSSFSIVSSSKMQGKPSIPEFFAEKTIFITGGSGFIGKVLIEKLLRSCPDVKKIYLLMRPKRGKLPEERIRSITDFALFDLLKGDNPAALEKLAFVSGDASQLKLGLNPEDRKTLIDEVELIFHGAASVRFDDPLTDSILLNTRGTRELLTLALEMKKLQVLSHISTSYCNTDRKVIGEQLYPAHADWEKTIEIVEDIDEQTLNILTKKFIAPLPNTYTFSKGLSEHVVYDLAKGKIPVVVFRPSIVVSSAKEPVPGWIDNFNGPVGLMVASGKGISRTSYSDPDIVADYVPVDLVVKALLISCWKKGLSNNAEKFEPTFYNASNNGQKEITTGEMVGLGKSLCGEIPLNDILWYPGGQVTKCYYYYFICVILYQLIPALFIDGLLKLTGHKPILTKIQRRIYVANVALHYYLHNQWSFLNDKTIALEYDLLPEDKQNFGYDKDALSPYEFFKAATLGARRYLLKEDDSTFERAKKHSDRMRVVSQIFTVLWYFGVFYVLMFKVNLPGIVARKYNDWYVYLSTD